MNDLDLLNATGAKIKYLTKQQEVISHNIANADTPGFKPKQLTPVDFGALVETSMGANKKMFHLGVARTNGSHLSPGGGTSLSGADKKQPQKMTYEVAPAGNAVILEEQMVKASDTRMNYDLMVNLYTKNMSLLRTAIGSPK